MNLTPTDEILPDQPSESREPKMAKRYDDVPLGWSLQMAKDKAERALAALDGAKDA